MSRIIMLSNTSFAYDSIYKTIEKNNIKIKNKNFSKIELENMTIIFKGINVNRANDYKKYKNDLLLYYGRDGQLIEELKIRCQENLKLVQLDPTCSDYPDSLTFFIKDNRHHLETRYWVGDGIFRSYVMTNDKEVNKPIIKRRRYGNTVDSYYLDKKEAIEEYRRLIKERIKDLNENKETIKKEYEEKLKENEQRIAEKYKLLKNPKIRF